jgi:RNA polymerase sigma-70 factor (ECF subfamily)
VDHESAIIAAVRSGDIEAFGSLVRTHQARVRLACLVLLGNAHEADDAAQDVFLKAFKGLQTYRGDSSFETWILKIADHHCLDLLRTRTRRGIESLEALLEERGDAFESFLARSQTSNDVPPYTPEDRHLLGRLFAALPEDDRQVLALREIENLPYEEIAERLSCSLDAVKGRLKRARQTLIDKCRKFF